ncbi:unnamed protein product [Victoria cruziana]
MGRAPCCEKVGLKRGPWSPEEDKKLVHYIQKHGKGNWRMLPKNAGLSRCGKSCRLRWTNYLRPDIRRGRFSFEEEEAIIQLHSVLGNKWSAIAGYLPGRTDNEIKNYWNTHIRKRLLRMGIDPVTHSLRVDLLGFSSIASIISSSLSHGIDPPSNPEILLLARNLLATQRKDMTNSCSDQYPMPHQANYSLGPQRENRRNGLNVQGTTNITNTQNLDQTELIQAGTEHDLAPSTPAFGTSTNLKESLPPSLNHNLFYFSSAKSDIDIFPSAFYSNDDQNCSISATLSAQNPGSYLPLSPMLMNTKSSTEDEMESFSNKLLRFASLELLGI